MAPSELIPDDAGRVLLPLARGAVANVLGTSVAVDRTPTWLKGLAASFVTITKFGELRGCIGSLQAWRPLIVDVEDNAAAAAFRDPRFEPVTWREFPQIAFEVSVLSGQTPIPYRDEADLLSQLVPGVDGLVLAFDGRRATFLPQVWEELPSPAEFLARLKIKAGLDPDYSDDRIEISRYTVRSWKEGE